MSAWIKTSDKRPNPYQVVLATDGFGVFQAEYVPARDDTEHTGYFWVDGKRRVDASEWMPMPLPPSKR
jgi:hypothetical protein